jgi:hypothetical protein
MAARCDIPTVENSNIKVRLGEDGCITLTFVDGDGNAEDLTGYTIAGQVRQGFTNASPALTFTGDNSDADIGIMRLRWTAAQAAAMPAPTFADDQVREDTSYGPWDAEITDPTATYTYRVAEGMTTYSREATQ